MQIITILCLGLLCLTFGAVSSASGQVHPMKATPFYDLVDLAQNEQTTPEAKAARGPCRVLGNCLINNAVCYAHCQRNGYKYGSCINSGKQLPSCECCL